MRMDEKRIIQLHEAIRKLVGKIYVDCYGAYGIGDRGYEGECESEIQNIIDILRALDFREAKAND